MANDDKAILAHKGTLSSAIPFAKSYECESPGQLEVFVLFTDIPHTLLALKKAGEWARDLHSRIRLIVPQVVPYPMDLEHPSVLLEFNERRFRMIAAEQSTDTSVEIYLCRDVDVLLAEVLPEHSAVVIGGRRRWWPTREEFLARRLRRNGYKVMFASDKISKEVHHA